MQTLKNIGKYIVVAISLLIIFFTGKAILVDVLNTVSEASSSTPAPIVEEIKKPDIYEIHANATDGVLKMLKSPSSAKFPVASKLNVVEYAPYNYRVSSFVDSQNSFGAMIRSNWIVEMELKDGYVTYHDIIID